MVFFGIMEAMVRRKSGFMSALRGPLGISSTFFHMVTEVLLLFARGFVFHSALLFAAHSSPDPILHLANSVLLALIILALSLVGDRSVKREKFILALSLLWASLQQCRGYSFNEE